MTFCIQNDFVPLPPEIRQEIRVVCQWVALGANNSGAPGATHVYTNNGINFFF